MELVQVDKTKCIKCGICEAVCPRGIITVKQGWPEAVEPDYCIACGHCTAACPTMALDNARSPLSGQNPLGNYPVIDSKTANQFLRSRRSIRCYKQTPVPREKLIELLDVARFAPTGGNAQGISYVIIENPQTLQQLSSLTVDWLEQHVRLGEDWAKRYAGYVKIYRETGADVILRNAPCLILATAAPSFTCGRENTHFAFSYAELYAPSLGLGTCWAGFFQACAFAGYQPLLKLLNLPADKQICGALMAGYPQYRYRRIPDRDPLRIEFI